MLRGCERQGRAHPPWAEALYWADAVEVLTLRIGCPSGRKATCEGSATIDPGPPVPRGTVEFAIRPGSLAFVYVPLTGRTDSVSPPLAEAVLEFSTTDANGRVVARSIPLRDLREASHLAF